MLGVTHGVLLWADMNAATPLGAWVRSVISLGAGMAPAAFDDYENVNLAGKEKFSCCPLRPILPLSQIKKG